MATEASPQLQFGQVIQKGQKFWVVTETLPHGYMSYALDGYQPSGEIGSNLDVLMSQGGNTIQGERPHVVGQLPPQAIFEAAHKHIDSRVPQPLRNDMHERVRRWALEPSPKE